MSAKFSELFLSRPAIMTGAAACVLLGGGGACAQDVDVLLWGGQPTADGAARYLTFGDPVINETGQVAVVSFNRLNGGASNSTVVQSSNAGQSVAARSNARAAGSATTRFVDFQQPTQSDAGHVAFIASLRDPAFPGGVAEGLFRAGPGGQIRIADTTQTLSGMSGPTLSFNNGGGNPTINGAGRVGFTAYSGSSAGGLGLYIADGPTPTLLARTEPNGNDLSDRLLSGVPGAAQGSAVTPALNDAGQAAFPGFVSPAGAIVPDAFALRTDQVTQELNVAFGPGNLAYEDDQAIAIAGISSLGAGIGFSLNASGQIVTETFDRTSSTYELIRLSPNGSTAGQDTVEIVADYGSSSPIDSAVVLTYSGQTKHTLNLNGQVAFTSKTSSNPMGAPDGDGLFLFDDLLGVQTIAQSGQSVPGASGEVFRENGFEPAGDGARFALNDAGQVAFFARLGSAGNGSSETDTLLFWDPNEGLIEVVRVGASLLGDTVESFGFSGGTNERGNERSGLNNAGEIAFSFALTDGRTGVAVWSQGGTLAGDYNDSGSVEQGDLNLVLNNWGQDASADDDGLVGIPVGWVNDPPEGQIDQEELNRVLNNWGQALPPSFGDDSNESTVPEPGLLLASLLGVWVFKPHRQQGDSIHP
ncbi:MAG: choice-of-anchor tandem repeat NxxGxxAF-containing protein [Planctomycetota bacterium]